MPGGRATLYALVPLGASCGGGDWQVADGHSHTDPSEMPSKKLCFLDCIALRLGKPEHYQQMQTGLTRSAAGKTLGRR